MACQVVWRYEQSPSFAAELVELRSVVEAGDHSSEEGLPDVLQGEAPCLEAALVCLPLEQSRD